MGKQPEVNPLVAKAVEALTRSEDETLSYSERAIAVQQAIAWSLLTHNDTVYDGLAGLDYTMFTVNNSL